MKYLSSRIILQRTTAWPITFRGTGSVRVIEGDSTFFGVALEILFFSLFMSLLVFLLPDLPVFFRAFLRWVLSMSDISDPSLFFALLSGLTFLFPFFFFFLVFLEGEKEGI